MPEDKEKGRRRMLYCQLNNALTKEVREVKMSAVQLLNTTYSIDIELFAELGHNFGVGGAHTNLGSCMTPKRT